MANEGILHESYNKLSVPLLTTAVSKALAGKLGVAAKKPDLKALLLALLLCALTAAGIGVYNLAVSGEAQNPTGNGEAQKHAASEETQNRRAAVQEQQADNNKDAGQATGRDQQRLFYFF